MFQEIISNILRFVFVVLLQVFVLNEIRLWGYINPFYYVVFILLLPIRTPGWLLLVLSFALGFIIDLFSNTMGLHSSACVFMAFCRPGILNFLAPREGYEFGVKPTVGFMGPTWFLAYAGTLVFIHHLLLFYLEVFRLNEFFFTLLRVLLSSVCTIILIMLTQYLTLIKKE